MIAIELAVLALLFALSCFFSGSETVVFSLSSVQRQRIRERSERADKLVGDCLADSAVLLSTILVGNTFVNFGIATIGYHVFVRLFPAGGWLTVPVMTIALLVFGEITPKQVALRYTEELAVPCARLLLFWRRILTPFNMLLKFSSHAFAKGLERERRALSDEELLSVVEASAERGEFVTADAEMIEGVLRLSELSANDEMTPRVDLEVYDLDLPEEARSAALKAGRHRFLPAIRRTPDAVEGVYSRATGQVTDALFVPETMTLDDLLVVFRRSKRDLAIVTDEYGGTAGVISPDDILELIFGPRVFSRPDAEPLIVKKGANVWEVDARANLDEINRELGIELEAEDADRLSGWMQIKAGRIPHLGQEIEADGCRATVLRRRRRRVTLVRIEVLAPPDAASDEEILAETDEAVERAVERTEAVG